MERDTGHILVFARLDSLLIAHQQRREAGVRNRKRCAGKVIALEGLRVAGKVACAEVAVVVTIDIDPARGPVHIKALARIAGDDQRVTVFIACFLDGRNAHAQLPGVAIDELIVEIHKLRATLIQLHEALVVHHQIDIAIREMRKLRVARHGGALKLQTLWLCQLFSGFQVVDQYLKHILVLVAGLHHPHHVVLLALRLIERHIHQTAVAGRSWLGGFQQTQQLR